MFQRGRLRTCRLIAVLICAAVVAALVPESTKSALAATVASGRVAGSDRFKTAVAISQRAFPAGADDVYLARSDDPADALAAGVLDSGPVLLVPRCGDPPDSVVIEVARLSAETVWVLGGTSAICEETALAAAGGRNVERIAGETRYVTAVLIAARQFPAGAGEVYLSGAGGSADAVAGGSLTNGPTLIVPRDGPVPEVVGSAIAALAPDRVVALGGTAALSDPALADAGAERVTARIAGASRIATSAAISAYRFGSAEATTAYLARSDNLSDALVAGSMTDGPILLVPSCGGLPVEVEEELRRLSVTNVIALGGPAAVCDAQLGAAVAVAEESSEVHVDEDAEVLPGWEAADLEFDAASGELRLGAESSTSDRVKVGHTIVTGPIPSAPSGLLVRVDAVDEVDGEIVAQTSDALLTDVVQTGALAASVPLGPDDLAEGEVLAEDVSLSEVPPADTKSRPTTKAGGFASVGRGFRINLGHKVLADDDGNPSTTNDQFVADGRIDVYVNATLAIDIGLRNLRPSLERFEFTTGLSENASIRISGSRGVAARRSVDLVRLTFQPITFFIGPVPVVIVPVATVSAGVEGSIEGELSYTVSQTFDTRLGATYRRTTGWQGVNVRRFSGGSDQFHYTGNMNGRAFLTATVTGAVYGAAGPSVTALGYIGLNAQYDSSSGWSWDFRAGLTADAGISALPILGSVASFQVRLLQLEGVLWSGHQ